MRPLAVYGSVAAGGVRAQARFTEDGFVDSFAVTRTVRRPRSMLPDRIAFGLGAPVARWPT